MPDPTRLAITRRQAFKSVGVSAIVLVGAMLVPVSATATTTSTAFVRNSIVARCLDTDWSRRFDVEFPAVVELVSSGDEGVRVGVQWDSRLFDVTPAVVVLSGDRMRTVKAETFSEGRMNLVIPGDVTEFYLQPRRRDLYPAENIGTPVPTTITLGSATVLEGQLETHTAAPWGLELRAGWDESGGYSYPSLIEVLSTGPNPVPVGVTIIARTYRDVSAMIVESDEGLARDEGPVRHNRVDDRAFILEEPLESGETFRILLAPAKLDNRDRVPSLTQTGQVFVTLPDATAVDARVTGLYSIASVTDSGTELSDYSTSRKA